MTMNMNECGVCGGATRLVNEKESVTVGSRRAKIVVERYRCDSCGEVLYTRDQAIAAQRAAAGVLRQEAGLLSPDQIRAIRRNLALTQAELETLLGVGPKTVVRWEKGTVFQSGSADQLLRLLSEVPGVLAHLRAKKPVAPGRRERSTERVVSLSDWRDAQRARLPQSAGTVTPLPEIPMGAMR